jgi:WD40 repeat protein
VALRPDGLQVATGGADGVLHVRDAVTGAAIVERKVHDGPIARVAFSRDATRILSIAPADTDVRASSAVDLSPLPVHSGQEGRLTSLATDAAGARVLAGALDGHAWLWLHDDAQRDAKLPSLSGAVLSLACDAHGERLLAAALGTSGHRLIDLRDGAQGAPLTGTGGPPSAVALNGAGTLAALASLQEPQVDLLDPATGELRARLTGPQGGVTDLCISADGKTLLASSQDHQLYAWSLPDGRLTATLTGHESLVSSCAISADGRRAASASVDGTVRLWDLPSARGRVLTSAAWYEDALVALSPDGRRVASASIHSDAVTVWNAETGEVQCTLTGHGTGVGALTFSPDGTRLFSASARDNAVRVWDARTGELLVLLAGHEKPVTALATSSDGRRLISGAADGSLRAWDAGE